MKRLMLVVLSVVLVVSCGAAMASAEAAARTKTGKVVKVDLEGKAVVVMVARELTFAVNDETKIVSGKEAKTLADIKVGDNVKVEYTTDRSKSDDKSRTATQITILAEKGD